MKIVIASTSELKVEACRQAFIEFSNAEFIPVKVPSGVNEQPMDKETLTGAFNRIGNARAAVPGADIYVSIENGIFKEAGKYIDRAVIVIGRGIEMPEITYSDGVEFPAAAVEATRKLGFAEHTVGKMLAEMNLVARHDDPHLDLSGKSRVSYMNEGLASAVLALK